MQTGLGREYISSRYLANTEWERESITCLSEASASSFTLSTITADDQALLVAMLIQSIGIDW